MSIVTRAVLRGLNATNPRQVCQASDRFTAARNEHPAAGLSARYGDDDALLWGFGIAAPIYGPAGGSYGNDYSDIDKMVLCSQVLALGALESCG